MEEPSQFSMGQTAQSLTCSITEKPHTGLDDCLNMLLSCFRKRMSGTWYQTRVTYTPAHMARWYNMANMEIQKCCVQHKSGNSKSVTKHDLSQFLTISVFLCNINRFHLGPSSPNTDLFTTHSPAAKSWKNPDLGPTWEWTVFTAFQCTKCTPGGIIFTPRNLAILWC